MADSANGINQSGGTPNKKRELTTEVRLLVAFILMGLVLFLTPYFYKAQLPPKPVEKPVAEQVAKPPADAAAAAREAPPAPKQAPEAVSPAAAGVVQGEQEQTYVLETDVYRVEFSNRGGVVRHWVLKNYLDNKGKPVDLVNSGASKSEYPFSLMFKEKKPSVDLNQVLYAAKVTPDKLGIEFEYSNGQTVSRKSFRFVKDSYLSNVSFKVTEGGGPLPSYLAWKGGFGDHTLYNSYAAQHAVYYDTAGQSLTITEAKEAADGPVSASGRFSFAGVQDTYFAAVFLPPDGGSFEILTLNTPLAVDGKDQPHVGAAVGGNGLDTYSLFVGPKDMDLLQKVDPKLSQLIDFGWFGFLARPLFLALNWANDTLVHNYGWSIILVTVLINFLLLPLKLTSFKSMKKMQLLQPQIAAINAKYKGISLRDPRKAEQNQEVMALYKRNGVNPMGGCMPMVLQIPFFFAFYKVLTVAIEMRGADWLWVADLSQPESLFLGMIRFLPLAMIGSQFFLQKMTPSTSMDPAQQRIMLLMPLMLGFMFYGVSSGLVLYWLTGNLVAIGQQVFFNRMSHATVEEPKAAASKPAAKGNNKKKLTRT